MKEDISQTAQRNLEDPAYGLTPEQQYANDRERTLIDEWTWFKLSRKNRVELSCFEPRETSYGIREIFLASVVGNDFDNAAFLLKKITKEAIKISGRSKLNSKNFSTAPGNSRISNSNPTL